MMAVATDLSKWTLISLLSCIVLNPQVVVIRGLLPLPEQPCSCWYIFGDSAYDNGNNNNLNTTVKVNHPPYGIDFPGRKATGRFSNGFNMADYLATYLGILHPIPSNADAPISYGNFSLNYASGGSGILNTTGSNTGVVIPLCVQMENHQKRIDYLRAIYGNQTADNILKKCLYTCNSCTNDYVNGYYVKGSNTSNVYTPEQYADILIQEYQQHMKTLYHKGARMIALFGASPIGIAPQQIEMFGNGSNAPVDYMNKAVEPFNRKLDQLCKDLNEDPSLPNATFLCIQTTNYSDIPLLSNLNITTAQPSTPCCYTSNETGLCLQDKPICPNRNTNLFWDGYHISELYCDYIAKRIRLDLRPICPILGS